MPRAGEAIDIELRAAVGRNYDPERYEESLRRVITECPDESERKAAEKRLLDLRGRRMREAANDADAASVAITRQDPLYTFERRFQMVGLLLRQHKQTGLVILASSGGFSTEWIDGGELTGMEAHTDRRRRGERAWRVAMDAVTLRKNPKLITLREYHEAVEGVILGRLGLNRASMMIGYADGSKEGRAELKRAVQQALGASGDYLGVA